MFDLEIQVLKKECSEGHSMPPHLHHYKNITIANVNSIINPMIATAPLSLNSLIGDIINTTSDHAD